MKKIALLTAAVLLTACGETVYRTNLEVYCPPMVQYTPASNEALAEELDALDEGYTTIPLVITDYVKLRDRIRTCEKEKDEYNGKR